MAKGQKRSNRETKKPKTSTKTNKPVTAQLANQPFQKKFEPGRKK